jgi:hypothetical protein
MISFLGDSQLTLPASMMMTQLYLTLWAREELSQILMSFEVAAMSKM